MKIKLFLISLIMSLIGLFIPMYTVASQQEKIDVHILKSKKMEVSIDKKTGGIISITLNNDRNKMNWIREGYHFGIGKQWSSPKESSLKNNLYKAKYNLNIKGFWSAEIEVTRAFDTEGNLIEKYQFTNKDKEPISFLEGLLGINAPFNDRYAKANIALYQRCNTHIWCGKNTSYVYSLRMGGDAPHLGLVLTEGSLSSYSVDSCYTANRGLFILNPEVKTLYNKESQVISWKIFPHNGVDDFYKKALKEEVFVQMSADRYSVTKGEQIRITAQKEKIFNDAVLFVNNKKVKANINKNKLTYTFTPADLGEYLVKLVDGNIETFLRLHVSLPLTELARRRCLYIVENQQINNHGEQLDGAYVVYDTEKNRQILGNGDRNTGRERIGMGILIALYLQQNPNDPKKEELLNSLHKFYQYTLRELQAEDGTVFNGVYAKEHNRLYNYPWILQLHMEMYKITKNKDHLQRMLKTARSYYKYGGINFYAICIPMYESVNLLKKAHLKKEATELYQLYKSHADEIIRKGENYPGHEVVFEQGIVAPAADYLSQIYRLSGDEKYLLAAKKHIARLKILGGNQPDYHLNQIAIRYWDGYWFGEKQLFGDTFPHYWSTLTAVAYHHYAKSANDINYQINAKKILHGNFNLFNPDGAASCAYLYPFKLGDQNGAFYDKWANDQDWALVFSLQYLGSNE